MRSKSLWPMVVVLIACAAAAESSDLAAEIYGIGKSAEPETKLTQWDGRAASFTGKIWVASSDASPPTLNVPAGEHSNLLVTCAKPLDRSLPLAVEAQVRLDGVISDVRRLNQTQGAMGMWLLALTGGATLLSQPPVLVTLDACKLVALGGTNAK